jgi:glycosyltransferase involved in cell wall biosynthesis
VSSDQAAMPASASGSGLRIGLESALPASITVGQATAVFCAGTCWHPHEEVTSLDVAVDGLRHRATAVRMPRPDVLAALHPAPDLRGGPDGRRDVASADDPEGRSYRSGFWLTVPIPARPHPGSIELSAVVRLTGGRVLAAPLGTIDVVHGPPAPPCPDVPACRGSGLIAVCMATFEPDEALFRAQLESLRAQSDTRWICLISDDCSGPEHYDRIREVIRGDPRFVVSRSPVRLGFYRNFERALGMVPLEAELVALCDQDDRWHADKLEVLRRALGTAQLVYSDQRLVTPDGRILRETLWRGRRNNHRNLASMLIANSITGAASLMPRETVELALPFPEVPGLQFHDHWIGVLALAAGDVAYVDRPLYDYVQHRGAVLGRAGDGPENHRRRRGCAQWPRPRIPRGTFERWRKRYFFGYLAREIQAQTALARCDGRLTASKRRALTRYVDSQRSLTGLAWLALRGPLRDLAGFNETLGTELELAQGVLWRRLVVLRAGRARWPRKRFDAGYPQPMSYEDMGFEQRRLRRWRAAI